jgi:hypothetical protein
MAFGRLFRKTIYGYVQKGLIPYSRIESNVRFLFRCVVTVWENAIFELVKGSCRDYTHFGVYASQEVVSFDPVQWAGSVREQFVITRRLTS